MAHRGSRKSIILVKPADVDQVGQEMLAWLKANGFASAKERTHKGKPGVIWLIKAFNHIPSAANPEQEIMNCRFWVWLRAGKARLHLERVPARKVDPNQHADCAAVVNMKKDFRLADLDSLEPIKQMIREWCL